LKISNIIRENIFLLDLLKNKETISLRIPYEHIKYLVGIEFDFIESIEKINKKTNHRENFSKNEGKK
jgi:hypothetical protein